MACPCPDGLYMLDLFEKTRNNSVQGIFLTNAVYVRNELWHLVYRLSHFYIFLLHKKPAVYVPAANLCLWRPRSNKLCFPLFITGMDT